MTSEIPKKPVSSYLRLFSQRTSIRGIPKIESAKLAAVRWFWAIFIFCAHVIMITLVVFLVMRYFRYDTTMKITTSRAEFSDFPEVTLCSKRFFDTKSELIPIPFNILDDYSKKVMSQISKSMKSNNFNRSIYLLKVKYKTAAFFHDNFKFVQQWTYNLSSLLKQSCVIKTLDSQLDESKKSFNCQVKPILHQEYLNCLAFSIPTINELNSSKSLKMEIDINFAEKPENALTESFKIDEYISNDFQDLRAYMHKPDDYPLDFNYELPIDCQSNNHYMVDKSTENQYVTGRSTATCNSGEFNTEIYGTPYKVTREGLCEELLIQNKVREQCKCFIDTLVTEDPTYPTTNLCSDNYKLFNCFINVRKTITEKMFSKCLPPCKKTEYKVLHKTTPFYSSLFSKKLEELFEETDYCSDKDDCRKAVSCLMKEFFAEYANVTCTDSKSDKITIGNGEATTLAPTITSMSQFTVTTSNPATNVNTKEKCKTIYIEVEMRQKMTVLTESLIVEVNTLFSQVGGMCSIFTGLTFTLIAEILETCIFWIYDKCSNKDSHK